MVITGIKATLYNYKLHYITKTIFCKHLFKKTREKIIKLRILWQISYTSAIFVLLYNIAPPTNLAVHYA